MPITISPSGMIKKKIQIATLISSTAVKKKETIGKHLEPQISNIFYLNNKMIEKVQKEKTESLASIKKKIKFYESYK